MNQIFVFSIMNRDAPDWGRSVLCTTVFPDTFLIEEPVLRMITEAVASLVWRRN